MFDKFSERHIGVSNEKDLKAMLDVIGVKSVDELISQVIPQSIRLRKPLALPAEGMSEYEFAAHIRELADRNQPYRSFIGMGYYPSAVPAVVTRNVFENPAWYTSYTPYQAEISQGRLEALLNFQTAVISLTGMEIGNCSLLDEGTAAAEAMAMMFSLRSRDAVREGRNQLFVDRNIFPQTLDVLLTRSEPFGIELIVDEYDEYEFTGREFGAIVQYPAADGRVRDYSDFTAAAHAKGALVTVAADLLSQAEHGGDSQAVLVCPSVEFARDTQRAVGEQLLQLRRGETIREALRQSRIVVLDSREKMIGFANAYAPEHLIISMRDAWDVAAQITAAGSVFIGPWSPESAGDYASGTNHTLPTGGWARAYSGVNTDSFLRKITYQELSRKGLATLSPTVIAMAEAEGLGAHAAAVRVRMKGGVL